MAQPSSYPSHPIQLILPYAPGGTGDVIARLVSEKLSVELGQPVIILNKPGAAGTIGAGAAARAKPDGYTLLLGYTSEMVISPYLIPDIPYSVSHDFVPVAMAGSTPLILVANPKLKVKDMRGFIALAKKQPNVLSYATAGVGSPADIAGRLLEKTTGIRLINVPYKGGGQATTSVVSGFSSIYFSGMPPAVPFIKSGNLIALGVTSKVASPAAPNVAALASAGFPRLDLNGWFGFFVQKGVDPKITALLAKKINAILQDPIIRGKLKVLGVTTPTMTQAQFANYVAHEQKKYAALIKELNIKY
ncbi:MAG: tripartite tricarboxylate transporter substrate binding protein [Candidimonas sp.]|nr:MAG: tripartite tricarboxylate transporter substrate binding protein [Candidimonas sp.]TAM74855.1 MAG: tripartite tricarboxylate transporter substrate binding protein [Candidimonas sp.]